MDPPLPPRLRPGTLPKCQCEHPWLECEHHLSFLNLATNSAATRYGSDRTFTTLSATGPPVITTNPATFVASFSATLNGSLDPHGLTTTVYFEYGTTTSYGLTTAPQSQTGNTFRNVSANISGLSASTTYHFRIVATNSSGTTYGSDRTLPHLARLDLQSSQLIQQRSSRVFRPRSMAHSIRMDWSPMFISSMARRPATASPLLPRLRAGTRTRMSVRTSWLEREHHLSFPNCGHQQRRHQVRQRQDLYHAYRDRAPSPSQPTRRPMWLLLQRHSMAHSIRMG